jgi:UDP-N-acetyl-D-galactosamine dehydrogenase
VDPYYLTAKAELLGYHPEVILAGRRINDSMGARIAQRVVRHLSAMPAPLKDARVGILGMTFKENVPDIRNSRSPDIVRELGRFGIAPIVSDPLASPVEVEREYGLVLADRAKACDLDAMILVVPHNEYLAEPLRLICSLRPGGILVDVKSALDPEGLPRNVRYWSL